MRRRMVSPRPVSEVAQLGDGDQLAQQRHLLDVE
jgi:hypothetical protein